MPKKSNKPTGLYSRGAIYAALGDLIKACGYDRSESATEDFYYLLCEAVDELDGTIEESHKEGLCYDMHSALDCTLQDILEKRSGMLN